MPWYQQVITAGYWVMAGLLALGALFDALSNAISLMTLNRAILCTVAIIIVWLISQIALRFRKIRWTTKKGETVTIKKLNAYQHFAVFGMIVLLWVPIVLPSSQEKDKAPPNDSILRIESVNEVNRGPLWGHEWFDDDEVVVVVRGGKVNVPSSLAEHSLVVFWHLAQNFETNWHVGRRRIGGNYELVAIKLNSLHGQADWELIVGGIECEKTYRGAVAIILAAVPDELLKQKGGIWVDDSLGWGLKELPTGESILLSQIKTFTTEPVR